MELLRPNLEMLADYVDALERGWSFDNVRGAEGARDDLEAIRQDAGRFVDSLYDPDALGSPIAFPDGSKLPRLPGYRLWMWDGEFCGSIGLRWQPGTSELPAYVLGHIGYGVVPWKQRRGYATRGLALALDHARAEGLEYVELTTDPANVASQKVMLANGAVFVERFTKTDHHGGGDSLRYRIDLRPQA
ncbi:MAG TPA: GNAT family N-acetyltransferase [Usitatibacter sp.]|nr:GNAT family N-acetyltransferase [Usitatibacter sp.]